jgi:DNA (cytosine-5)-methyltransferase 1
MEQVRAVLPLWETYARCLTILGYKAWAGCLHAEQYGVPQARQRAWLIADKSLHPSLEIPPKPTHSKYHNRKPERLDEGVLPWVSMAEALGWGDDRVGWMVAAGVTGAGRPRLWDHPAPTITGRGTAYVLDDLENVGPSARASDPGTRRLTVEEAATLQGFPEGFTFAGSRTSQFRQVGNAVNPPVARAILKGLGW